MTTNARTFRTQLRLFHLVLALAVGTYVYAPEHVTDPMRPVMMFVLLPLTALTGLAMWKQAALRRMLGGGSGASGSRPGEPVSEQ